MNCMNVRIGNILKNDIKQNNECGYNIQNQSLYIVTTFYMLYVVSDYIRIFKKGDIDA